MPQTKPADAVLERWQRKASQSGPDYQRGVQNPRVAWDTASAAADANYRAGVTAAANAGRFAAGVRAAGNARWIEGATKKGPGRFTEGVMLGGNEYGKQIQTVLTTIQGVQLPPRGPKGSPQNFQRIQPIGEALRRAFGKTGAGGTR